MARNSNFRRIFHICDEMKVKAKNKEMIYFFDTSRIFEQYSKMGKKEDKK